MQLTDFLPGDEGVIAAYIPSQAIPQEYPYRDGRREFTLYAVDDTAIDMLPADGKNTKWWLVKEAARQYRLEIVEPIWHGPVNEFKVECLPSLPMPEGHQLAVRLYSAGPWIKLPKEMA